MYVGKEVDNFGAVKRNLEQNGCSAGLDTFNITPDGKLIPCCAFHLELGNLHTERVKEILNHSDILKWWRDLKLKSFEECGRKDYCDFCNLCPGNNYSEHGTPIKCSENNMYIAKARYNLMQKKMQGINPLGEKELNERLSDFPEYKREKLKREMK